MELRSRIAVGVAVTMIVAGIGVGAANALGGVTSARSAGASSTAEPTPLVTGASTPDPTPDPTTTPSETTVPEPIDTPSPVIAEPAPPALNSSGQAVYRGDTDLDSVVYPESLVGDELENAREWMQTNKIVSQCMAEKGFDYFFTPYWMGIPEGGYFPHNLPEDQRAAANIALDGAPDRGLGDDYRWDEAGCWGYAVHVMGNDENN